MLLIGANPKAKIAKLKTVSATSLFMILPSFVQVTTTGQIKGFLTGDRPWSIGVWRPATEKPLLGQTNGRFVLRGSAGQRSRMSSKNGTSARATML